MQTYHHLVIGNGKLLLKYNKWLYICVVSNSSEVWRESLPTLVSKSRMWYILLRQEVKCYLPVYRKDMKTMYKVFKRFRLLLVTWWPGVTGASPSWTQTWAKGFPGEGGYKCASESYFPTVHRLCDVARQAQAAIAAARGVMSANWRSTGNRLKHLWNILLQWALLAPERGDQGSRDN